MRKGEISLRIDAQFYVEVLNCKNFVKLGDYVKVKGGKRIPKGLSYSSEETDFLYLRVDDIDSFGEINFQGMRYISDEIFYILKNYKLNKNEVIISNAGTIGKIALLEQDLTKKIILTENCAKLQITNKELLPRFLKIVLLLPIVQKQMTLAYIQTTIPKLALERIYNLRIPKLPSQETQKKIIDFFETAYSSKKQKESQAAELLASIDSYLLQQLGITLPPPSEKNNSFKIRFSKVSSGRFDPAYFDIKFSLLRQSIETGTYKAIPVGKVCNLLTSGKTPAKLDYSDNPSAYPVIKVASYSGDTIDLTKTDYANNPQPYTVQKGDIFVLSAAHQAEYVGRFVKQLDEEPEIKTSFVGELICLRANPSIVNPNYLFALFSSPTFQTLLNCEKRGQTSHIYSKDIKHILIPLPPPEKQTEIANHISAIRTQAKQLQQQAAAELEQAKLYVEHLILGSPNS